MGEDASGFHLHHDVRDDIEGTEKGDHAADELRVPVVVRDHVSRGDVSAFASDAADGIAEDVDRSGGHREIEGIEHRRNAVAVDPSGKGEDGEARKIGRHDGERGGEHPLAAACEVVVRFGVLGPPALQKAKDPEGKEPDEIEDQGNVWNVVHQSSSFQRVRAAMRIQLVMTRQVKTSQR